MTLNQLKEKALSLPLVPGVYIMRDNNARVIYIGKAKKLKNRVSQYFQDTASHTPKTRLMVSNIDNFDVIITESEFESLVLESSLIKRHKPKFNILLKDDKGYPYVRINTKASYPKISVVNKISNDGAEYFGPFGSKGSTEKLVKTISQILKLPDCNRSFPRDIGKGRPCLNYHMEHCAGWCRGVLDSAAYKTAVFQAKQLLLGQYKTVAAELRKEMLEAADAMQFELAAGFRNRLQAVETLGKRQTVVAGKIADVDVIGYGETEVKACFAVLHYSNGDLIDKEFEVFAKPDDAESAVSSLTKQYYLGRGIAPKLILIPFAFDDSALFSQLLEQDLGHRVEIKFPQRGNHVRLIKLANSNAVEEAVRLTDKEEHRNKILDLLKATLNIPSVHRIEAFDISNISGTDNVAGMVVVEDGKPKRNEYRYFKIDEPGKQDDYASMECAVRRRFRRFLEKDEKFSKKPDVLLIDGGMTHAAAVVTVLREMQLFIPVFGMVKDDRHRTRALVTPNGEEIAIDTKPVLFSFIGKIQEETHRHAISYHKKLRSKRLRYSTLDAIPGVGAKRKELLLKQFKSLNGIAAASLHELERVLPKDVAYAVQMHFKEQRKEGT